MSVIPTAFNQGLGYIPVYNQNCTGGGSEEGNVTYTDTPDYELQQNVSGTPTTITRVDVENVRANTVNLETSNGKLTLDTGSIFNHSANTYMGIRGQYTTNFDFSIGFWDDGHTRYQTSETGGGHRFYIRDTVNNTTVQKFRIDDAEIICDTELFINNGATIQAPTFSDPANCRVMFLDSNSGTGKVVSNNQLFFNPNNETLRTSNFRVTDTAEILNLTLTGTNNATMNIDTSVNNYGLLMNSSDGYIFRMAGVGSLRIYSNTVQVYDNLQVDGSATIDGDITKNTATLSGVSRNMNVLFHDNQTNDKRIKENNAFYFNPADEMLTATNITSNDEIYYKGQTLDQRFTAQSFALPIGYTTVFSTRPSDQDNGYPGWRMFNASVFGGIPNGRVFGFDNEVEWPLKASSNAEPTISEYGANVTNTSGVKSAINFQINTNTNTTYSRYFGLSNNAYAGWWNIRVSLVYQDTSSQNNFVPMIRLRTGPLPTTSGPTATTELPQTSRGFGLGIHDICELVAEGPVYLGSTATNVYISTLMERGAVSTPPDWGDEALESEYWGNSINIQCTFLGNTGINNETVTVLP